MRQYFYILYTLILIINLSGQTHCDTIPQENEEFEIVTWVPEKYMIFKDFHSQHMECFENIDLNEIDCYGERVFVSTIFGKNGKISDTKVVRPASRYCDSVAFQFVNGLKGWLPGMSRGRFVDIPFMFPITFDSSLLKKKAKEYFNFFEGTEDEFIERKKYFDFIYSSNSQKIINDFTYFYKYVGDKLSGDSLYIHYYAYSKPKNKNRVKVELINENKDSIDFIIYYPDNPRLLNYILAKEKGILYWDKNRWAITPNFTPAKKNGYVYLEKNKRIILIGFFSGKDEPKLAVYRDIIFKSDTALNLDLKRFNKNELINEMKYSP